MKWKAWQKKDRKYWYVEKKDYTARIERTDKDGKLNYRLTVAKADKVIDVKMPSVSAFVMMKTIVAKEFKTLEAAQVAAVKAMQ